MSKGKNIRKDGYFQRVKDFEIEIITDELVNHRTVEAAARTLELRRTTLVEKMRQFKIIPLRQPEGNMKFKLLATIALMFVGCTSTQPKQPDVIVLPESSQSSGIVFKSINGYATNEEVKLLERASKKANETKTSQCYFDFIANRKMIQTQGHAPEFIAKQIKELSGDVPVQFYYSRFTSARAYRAPPGKTIYLNRKFITPDSDLCDVAGTILHESLHALLNYEHDFEWSPSREYSVPYSSDHAFASGSYSQSPSGGCCK